MLPAFRSNLSAISFCALLIALLCLPLVTSWVGHPSRAQAYAGLPKAAGAVSMNVRAISGEGPDADVLFLGSSIIRAGIDMPAIERAMSAHLGRPAHIDTLALNWQGLDLQYFLLRDYLNTHRAGLIIWNLPVPGSRTFQPHIEAFHWVRFAEYSDALSGLPLRYRLALYSDMVLGAPRELLSHLRPNLLSKKEKTGEAPYESLGYYGATFVPESADSVAVPTLEQSYEVPPETLVRATGKPLNSYDLHFADEILDLAKKTHTRIALLHIPMDTEQGLDYMPERENWTAAFHTDAPMIGVPSSVLFKNVGKLRFYHFYRDQHLNINGKALFTRSMLPAILKAYDERNKYE